MMFQDAVSLINHPGIMSNDNTTWADLGCGNGLFSKALASLPEPLGSISIALFSGFTFIYPGRI